MHRGGAVEAEDGAYPGFRDFASARSAALIRTAYLLTGDQHAAEDLVQEALSRVVGRWQKVVAGGDPEPYVRRVMYTVHVSRWRRDRGSPAVQAAPAGDEAETATRRVVLRAALMRLSRKQRAVLVLRFYEDLTVAAAAQALGVTQSTVKSQTQYALTRLRELAGDDIAELWTGVLDDPRPDRVSPQTPLVASDGHSSPTEVSG